MSYANRTIIKQVAAVTATWRDTAKVIGAMAFTLLALVALGFVHLPAAETVSLPAPAGASPSSLPACVNSEPAFAEVKRSLTTNSGDAKKYDGYRTLLQSESALVLAARLVYAETAAANCPAHNEEILELIASVIGNRIRIRHGDVNSVVFQRNQFASSLHIYTESRYRDFLCPDDVLLWQQAIAKMQANVEGVTPTAAIPKDTVNYYVYKHSDRFTAPDWGLEEVKVSSEDIRKCIRVFRSPAWR